MCIFFSFLVEYYSSDLQSGWVVTAHHVAGESHVVQNLRPDTHYQFLVRAENSHGLSLPSPSSKVIRTQGNFQTKGLILHSVYLVLIVIFKKLNRRDLKIQLVWFNFFCDKFYWDSKLKNVRMSDVLIVLPFCNFHFKKK